MNLHFALWAQQIIAHTFVKLCRPNMGSLMTAKCRKGNLSPNTLSHTRVFQQTQPHFKVGGRQPRDLRVFFCVHKFFTMKCCGCSFLAPNISSGVWMSWPPLPCLPAVRISLGPLGAVREPLTLGFGLAWILCLKNLGKKHTEIPLKSLLFLYYMLGVCLIIYYIYIVFFTKVEESFT